MRINTLLLLLGIAAPTLTTAAAHAADEETFLGEVRTPSEQTLGHGRTALWTLPQVATQYQPVHTTPALQKAMQAQNDGRFLDAMIVLDEARKGAQVDAMTEIDLLRASFLLQGNQPGQALDILAPLVSSPRHAASVHALTAMAHLQQGKMPEALKAAQQAHEASDGALSNLAQSYVLQGSGRLTEARGAIHEFNNSKPQAITLAREAELALTLGQNREADALVRRAQAMDAAHPYVVAVSGLSALIDGQPEQAKSAFETALRRDPKDAKALLGLGLAETRLGNFDEGQKKLQAANEADPGNALILTYLGRAQQQSGQTAAARESWRSATQADPKDPAPWLYLAQAQLQANRLTDARESLREAEARTAYRAVYRGAGLLQEDEQLLRINLAETQRRLGMGNIAFHTLADPVGEKNSASLRAQAELLQGQRFAESARRSLLLQSQFNEHPGSLPPELDIYGDGAGQTGASNPQHGPVSLLGAQQASYNNYDELFSRHAALEADGIMGNQNTSGEQFRAGFGSDTLGVGLAQRAYKNDGIGRFESMNNRIEQGIVQWRPTQSTQAFASHYNFDSLHLETMYPGDPQAMSQPIMLADHSRIIRLGLRQSLHSGSELRALWSEQHTGQTEDYLDMTTGQSFWTDFSNSTAHSTELQYRTSGAGYATQWGAQQHRAHIITPGQDNTRTAQQFYAAWQQALNPYWQLDAQLGRGKIDNQGNVGRNSTHLSSRWLPKLGLVYAPDTATHVRAAAWRGMGLGEIGEAALTPVSLAGILLGRPGDTTNSGRLVQAVALGADKQLSPAWLLEGQAQRRKTEEPYISSGQQVNYHFWVKESRLVLHWLPEGQPWSVSLASEYEYFKGTRDYHPVNSVQEQTLRAQQLDLRWFATAQWTANVTLSRNRVDGTFQINVFSDLAPYQDSFKQVDAGLSWQFSQRGQFAAGVRNATDKRFQYTNIDPLNPRFSNGRLVYGKLKLAW